MIRVQRNVKTARVKGLKFEVVVIPIILGSEVFSFCFIMVNVTFLHRTGSNTTDRAVERAFAV